jgi:hypothetical protein
MKFTKKWMVVPFVEDEYEKILKNNSISNEKKVHLYNELIWKKNSKNQINIPLENNKDKEMKHEIIDNKTVTPEKDTILNENNNNNIETTKNRNSSFYYKPFENTRINRKKRDEQKKLNRKLIFDESRNFENVNDDQDTSYQRKNPDLEVNKKINLIWQHLENNENITRRNKDLSKKDKNRLKYLINTVVKTEKKRKLIHNLKENKKKRKLDETEMMETSQI